MFICFQFILWLHIIGSVIGSKNYFETYFIEPNRNGRNAVNLDRFKWPDGIVHYVFDSSFTGTDVSAVLTAMRLIVEKTCVKFVVKDASQKEHIRFVKSRDGQCGSNIGYRPDRAEPLDVTFADGTFCIRHPGDELFFLNEYFSSYTECLKMRGAIQHELLHVLGLLHEQCRPDRDDFIEILWDNIDSRFHRNFMKGDFNTLTTFDLPYDYDSLMHYPGNAFAMPGKNVTIVSKKDSKQKLGQSDEPTFSDLEKIRRMYNCPS